MTVVEQAAEHWLGSETDTVTLWVPNAKGAVKLTGPLAFTMLGADGFPSTVHTKANVPPSASATFAERATWQLGEAQVSVTRSRQLVMVGLLFFAASYAPTSIRPPTLSGRGN